MQVIHKNNRSNEAKNAKSLGLTCFQFAFALLLLSSHTLLEISGSGRLRSPLMHVVNRVKIIVSTRPSRDHLPRTP